MRTKGEGSPKVHRALLSRPSGRGWVTVCGQLDREPFVTAESAGVTCQRCLASSSRRAALAAAAHVTSTVSQDTEAEAWLRRQLDTLRKEA
jgi:hypothetical protein